MEKGLLEAILPAFILDYFEIKDFYKLGNVSTKKDEYFILLDELNILPEGYVETDYESKGFLPASRVQDFPIRGKAVYLVIRRRRWRHKRSRKEITRDFKIVSEGSRLTQELSDFLKGTGRDPRRYDK